MTQWLKRFRGTMGMGLTWAAGWAIVGLMIGVLSILTPSLPWDAFFSVFDAPLPSLGVPGFFGGAFFSIVLGIAGRHRRFEDLSLAGVAAWGAVGGVLLGLLPGVMVAAGLATPRAGLDMWLATVVISGPLIFLSAISATLTLLIARKEQARSELVRPAGPTAVR